MTPALAALFFTVPLLAGTAEFPELAPPPLLPAEGLPAPVEENPPPEPEPAPAAGPTRPEQRRREEPSTHRIKTLLALGPTVLGLSYVAAVVAMFASIECHGSGNFGFACSSESGYLLIPVAGPWAALADPPPRSTAGPLIALDGALQALGLATLITGIVIKVPDEPEEGNWSLSPGAPGAPYGLTFDFRFP